MQNDYKEKRSTKLIKPILYFSIEIFICIELIYVLSLANTYTLYFTIILSLIFIYFSSVPRLIKIINRIVEMKKLIK